MERTLIAALSLALAFTIGVIAGGGVPDAVAANAGDQKCYVLPEWKPKPRKWADEMETTLADLHARGSVQQIFVANPAAQGSAIGEGGLIIVCAIYE